MQPAVHVHRLRVRYCETDQMGVAHHGSYVDWLEEARTEWMRSIGRSYRSMEERGLYLAVVRMSIRFLESVRYEDLIRVEIAAPELGRASVELGYRLLLEEDAVTGRAGGPVAEAVTRLAVLNEARRPIRVPTGLFDPGGA